MPNNPVVQITPEADTILENVKEERQGYSKCLLASEAIKQAYGRRVAVGGKSEGRVHTEHQITALRILEKQGGNAEEAIKTIKAIDGLDNATKFLMINTIKTEAGL